VAIGGLSQGKWRAMWAVILVVSFILLLSTGARGSFVGFAAGAGLILFILSLHAKKRSLLIGLLIMIVLGSALWSTGAHNTFLDNCMRLGSLSVPKQSPTTESVPETPINSTGPTATDPATNDSGTGAYSLLVVVRDTPPVSLAPVPTPVQTPTSTPIQTPVSAPAAEIRTMTIGEGVSTLLVEGTITEAGEFEPLLLEVAEGTTVDIYMWSATSSLDTQVWLSQELATNTSASSIRNNDDDNDAVPAAVALEILPGPVGGSYNSATMGTELPSGTYSIGPRSFNNSGVPATVPGAGGAPAPIHAEETVQRETPLFRSYFFKFTGRTAVWEDGWGYIKSSPLIGYGFHSDRLLLGTHMHNSVMHSLIQAGFIGAILFAGSVVFAWLLFFRIVRRITLIPGAHKGLAIQCGGVLAYLTVRSIWESTGAFFGVDWLVLALVLTYLQVVNYGTQSNEVNGDYGKLAGG